MTNKIDFKLKNQDLELVELAKVKANYTVLFFYPKDNTSGCTIEAKEFSDHLKDFKALKTEVFGISGLDEKSKKKFCDKQNLKVTLLADPNFTLSKKLKVYGKKKFMGREYLGITRTTFILDKNKNILQVYEKVKPLGHAKEILDFLKAQ
jgi:peroxiredoxin Q/BCP